MNMRYIRFVLAFAAVIGFNQISYGMNLQSVFKEAVAKNETLVDQSERLIQAKEHYSQAFSLVLPNLTGSYNYFDLDTNSIPSSSTGASNTPNQFTTKLTLTMPIYRGGRDYAAIDQSKALILAQENYLTAAALTLFQDASSTFYLVLSLENDKVILEKEAALYQKI